MIRWRHHWQAFWKGPDYLEMPRLHRKLSRYRSLTVTLSAWLSAWALRVMSPVALIVLPVAALTSLYALIAVDSPGRLLLLVFLALLLVELGVGGCFRPRIAVFRRVPERVRTGSEFTVVFEWKNRRRWAAFDLFADPFRYSSRLTLRRPARLGELPGGAVATVESSWLARRRGVVRLYRPIVESRFPLGLLKWSCRGSDREDRLVIYPAYMPLRFFDLPLGALGQNTGAASCSRVGESPELLGSRDYREGDEVRRIDWPGSARRGELVVKEFEEERLKRVALVVDTFAPLSSSQYRKRAESPELEAALSLAAAITEYLVRGEAVVDLFAAGAQLHRIRTGRHTACLDAVLDILAAIEPEPAPVLEKLAPEVFAEIARIGGAVVVLLGDDAERRAFVRNLALSGASLRVILLGRAAADVPADWRVITPEAVLAGRILSL